MVAYTAVAMTTTIGPSVSIQGDLTSDEDLIVDGHVRGQIRLHNAELTIGPTARIEADVTGPRVVVLGTLTGHVAAGERIVLGGASRVTGSLSANLIVIDDGARFNGHIDMNRRTIAAKVAQYKQGQR